MSCPSLTTPVEKHLITVVTTDQFAAYTDWMPTIGLDAVRAVYNVTAKSGNFRYQLAYQTAVARTDNPDAWNSLDSLRTASGATCTGDVSLTGVTGGKFFIRFGILFNETSAPATAQADVSLQLAYLASGKVVGSGTYQLLAPDTAAYYQPVTGWMPVIAAAKHRAAFVTSGTSANLRFKVAFQTAETSTSTPNTWSTDDTDKNGDGEACTSDITPTGGTAGVMWIRFGIKYFMSSGTNGSGSISIAIGGRA